MYGRLIVASAVAFVTVGALPAAAADFRGFDWGATLEEVLTYEKAKLDEKGVDYLSYWTTFGGYEVLLAYYFDPEFGLNGADYGLAYGYANPEKYMDAFNGFSAALSAEFGEGDLLVEWRDRSLEQTYAGKLGEALADGEVKLLQNWVTERTSVYLSARKEAAEAGEVLVTVHYYSVEYLEKAKEKPEEGLPAIKKHKI